MKVTNKVYDDGMQIYMYTYMILTSLASMTSFLVFQPVVFLACFHGWYIHTHIFIISEGEHSNIHYVNALSIAKLLSCQKPFLENLGKHNNNKIKS